MFTMQSIIWKPPLHNMKSKSNVTQWPSGGNKTIYRYYKYKCTYKSIYYKYKTIMINLWHETFWLMAFHWWRSIWHRKVFCGWRWPLNIASTRIDDSSGLLVPHAPGTYPHEKDWWCLHILKLWKLISYMFSI